MSLMSLALALVLPAAAQPVRTVAVNGGQYAVNGLPASMIGVGTYKDVLVMPQNSDLVLKVFRSNLAESLPEKRLEVANIQRLEPVAAVPKLVEQGALPVGGKPTGYVVQERVRGLDLARPTPTKLAETKILFDKLKKARVELVDVSSLDKLRANIMIGETLSGGFGAYLVDADIRTSEKTKAQLDAFYDGLLQKLARP